MTNNTGKDSNTDDKDEKIKKSLKYSVIDGSFYSAMVGFGESFFSAFAVFLKATNIQLGILSTLPQTVGSFCQLLSRKALSVFKSRKKMVVSFAFLQGLIYLILTYVFFVKTLAVYHLILLVTLYLAFGMIISPAWTSWMGDLVDEHSRGVYFGKRNRITGIIAFTTFLIGGYVLQRFTEGNVEAYGFIVLFFIAFFSRMGSLLYLLKKYDPPHLMPKKVVSFADFLSHAKERNFGMFVIFLSIMNFAVYIATPFFTPYMLTELNYNYLTFAIVSGTMIIIKYITMPVWGKACDVYGTKKVLKVSGFLIPFVPLLWVFSTNLEYLILVQVLSGFAWAGFELASFNFIFDATKPEERVDYVAYYNVLNGVAILIGALIGAVLLRYNHLFGSAFFLVCVISFVLRLLVSFLFLPKIKEPRKVTPISEERLLLKVVSGLTLRNTLFDMISFKKK